MEGGTLDFHCFQPQELPSDLSPPNSQWGALRTEVTTSATRSNTRSIVPAAHHFIKGAIDGNRRLWPQVEQHIFLRY